MKKIAGILVTGAFATFLCLLPYDRHVAASGAVATLMSAQTAAGASANYISTNITTGTPTELGSDRYVFQYVANALDVYVTIESSLDSGATWAPVYTFGRHGLDETWSAPVCGLCRFEARKLATTVGAVSIYVNISGTSFPITPANTATPTPANTPTPTATLTPTFTQTFTPTPTFTATFTPYITATARFGIAH